MFIIMAPMESDTIIDTNSFSVFFFLFTDLCQFGRNSKCVQNYIFSTLRTNLDP